MPRWRKRAVVIEAEQFFPEVQPWPAGVTTSDESPTGFCIATLEHTTVKGCEVSPGDWIIRGVQGELYPCKPDIFEATYDAVEEVMSPESETIVTPPPGA